MGRSVGRFGSLLHRYILDSIPSIFRARLLFRGSPNSSCRLPREIMPSTGQPTLKQEEIKKPSQQERVITKKRSGRRSNENFGKRKRSLVREIHETGRLYEADVYIAVRRKGRCTIYTNYSSPSWPPRREDIVGCTSSFHR